MARLNLNFLGSFGVSLDKQAVTHFRSTKVQALLLYLSLQPDRSFSRAVLAALFWPEESPSNAKNNLRQSLHRLKKVLPHQVGESPYLDITRQAVTFNLVSNFQCDVHRFEQLLAEGKVLEATQLYRGELAAGFTADSLEFEEWLRLEREYLRSKALNGLKALTEQELAAQHYPEAQAVAQRHLQLDPWGEAAHRNLMLALALNGDRSGALAAYESCVTVLYAELGVDPEDETLALAEKIKAGALEREAIAVGQAASKRLDKSKILDRLDPLPDQKLFGVKDLLKTAINAVENEGRPWLLSFDGLGGIGKTTMANELVHHFLEAERFLDIAWVSAKQEEYVTGKGIRAIDKPALDPESCIDQLLAQLAEGPYPANNFDAKRLALHQILQEKPALIVIDNLETVADYAALLPLLRFLSRPSKILVTTRRSLRHESDIFCLNLSELPETAAIQLLKHEAQAQEIGPLLHPDEEMFCEIYQTIGGNPLALKLAIGQAHYLPLEQILAGLRVTKEQQASDLYAYIYWQAWQMLDKEGRHLFVSLPMVPNATFEQLEMASGLASESLQHALMALRSLSLVELGTSSAFPRYRIHRLTETFLLDEVIRWQKSDAARRAPESGHFEERLEVVLDHWQKEHKTIIIDVKALDQEKEGILKAVHFGLDLDPSWPVVKQLISSLTSYMERWGHWVVWHDTLVRAIDVAQRLGDIDGELVMMNLRGRILQRLSRSDELIKNYRRVIRTARRAGNRIEEGRACSNLGFNLIMLGRFSRAEVFNCHALDIFNQENYQHGMAHTHNHLGVLFTTTGQWMLAEKHLDKACEIWRSNNDNHGLIYGFENLGLLFNNQHQFEKAIPYLQKALVKAEEANEIGEIANIYINLSYSKSGLSQPHDAEKFARMAEELYRKIQNYDGIYLAHLVLGSALHSQGQLKRAEAYLNASKHGFTLLSNKKREMEAELSLLKGYLEVENTESINVSIRILKRWEKKYPQSSISNAFTKLLADYGALSTAT
ncbi:MAG: BTAD domain-containing putative transcriptional regulator [Chloroflexota bacterium]